MMEEPYTCNELEFQLRGTASFEELQTRVTKFSDEYKHPPVIAVYPPNYPDARGFALHATLRWYEEGQPRSAKGVDFGVLEMVSGILFGYRTTTADWAKDCFHELKEYFLRFGWFSELATTKQKGRYRLTKKVIADRKKKVRQANKLKTSDNTWVWVANQVDIPERTLRDWRHNPEYQ